MKAKILIILIILWMEDVSASTKRKSRESVDILEGKWVRYAKNIELQFNFEKNQVTQFTNDFLDEVETADLKIEGDDIYWRFRKHFKYHLNLENCYFHTLKPDKAMKCDLKQFDTRAYGKTEYTFHLTRPYPQFLQGEWYLTNEPGKDPPLFYDTKSVLTFTNEQASLNNIVYGVVDDGKTIKLKFDNNIPVDEEDFTLNDWILDKRRIGQKANKIQLEKDKQYVNLRKKISISTESDFFTFDENFVITYVSKEARKTGLRLGNRIIEWSANEDDDNYTPITQQNQYKAKRYLNQKEEILYFTCL